MRLRRAKFSGLAILVCCMLAACMSDATSDYQDWLSERVNSINQKCPQMLDSETRIDGLQLVEPNTLVYNCTLVRLSVSAGDTAEFKRAVWPGLLSSVRVSRDFKKLRANNTNICFRFAGKEHQPICTIKITPEDYQ